MSKKNSIQRSEYINEEYKNYLRSTFKFGDENLQNLFVDQLEKEDLFKGPYVDLNLPFTRGKTINDLIYEGIICKSFESICDVDFDRPLYLHQEKSIRHINSGNSAIVTTGTGSGKTECFLFPIINDLLKDYEKGNSDIGIRAIFLYPMNALVIDQVDRLRKLLANTPQITFGFFTGDTPEHFDRNNPRTLKKFEEENGFSLFENELVSREEIRNNPPHLLFTNYSMLEYLLIRPNDYSIFEHSRLKNWKYVVLDEAHSYNGALGIELSMLMRRLTGLSEKKPRFILTSATLGERGKSESDIIKFATSLTSVDFDVNDIIFSDKIALPSSEKSYTIDFSDYSLLKDKIDKKEDINEIVKKYNEKIITDNIYNALFDLLKSDKNVRYLYSFLINKSKSIESILKHFKGKINKFQLSSFIDLINMAEKGGINLFTLKYHSFIRPLNGAYITGDKSKLSLTKAIFIDDKKAFEVGNCRYCNAPYVIGRIFHNNEDQLDYLLQNSEIDIYENYGSDKNKSLDYFLFSNRIGEAEDEDEIDNGGHICLIEYTVCEECGAICETKNLNAKKCNCNDSVKFQLYKVETTNTKKEKFDSEAYNNIRECPCCRHRSHTGIVKNLNLGKDEGTALIGRLLLESLDEADSQIEQVKSRKISLLNKPKIEVKNVKQFLTFSDSRQQASFAAVFFDALYTKLLQRRIVWEIVKQEKYKTMSVEKLHGLLSDYICKKKLLKANNLSADKNAWITILIDLLRVDGAYDPEGLGLYYYELDLSKVLEILHEIESDEFEELFGKYGLNFDDVIALIQVVLGLFKTTPAINYSEAGLTNDEKENYLEFRHFNNAVALKNQKTVAGVRSFLPVKQKENLIVRYVMKVCGCEANEAQELLEKIFDAANDIFDLFETSNRENTYVIPVSKYLIKNYKETQFYKCSKCGTVTPYNIHGACVKDRCEGKLKEVDLDDYFKNNAYRRQYKEKTIEDIIIKEHTAQIKRKEAKFIQNEFKEKKINILSCSTTFEMGVDIGSLENVFMRNVPPSPANYVQRAGRAGRRKDSSAYVITYCGTGSHDYTYFLEPEKMICGTINPPFFDIYNKKIIERHLMAVCLGFFFRMYPGYAMNIEGLVFGDGLDKFKNYINSHPVELNNYINNKFLCGNKFNCYHDFKWFDTMNGNDEKLVMYVKEMRSLFAEFEEAEKEASDNKNYNDAQRFKLLKENLKNGDVVSCLSDHCVIPKYGFPVDVVNLAVYEEGYLKNDEFDLNRDLKIAISEYAPDSEVIAGGKKFTSKYISFPKTSNGGFVFAKNYFRTCKNCNKVNIALIENSTKCKYCGNSFDENVRQEYFIEPKYGFKTGENKKSTRLKPKKTYAGEVTYLGGGKIDKENLEIGSCIVAETSVDDELLILNRSKFYVCLTCGFGMVAKDLYTRIEKSHLNYLNRSCNNERLELLRLGHRFKTDVIRFKIPSLLLLGKKSISVAYSFLYAFIEGISQALEIERDDIDGVIEENISGGSYDVLVFDNVPGGAGHVKRLMDEKAIINSLEKALDKVSQDCCCEDTSCYNCLRSYYNQAHHKHLERGLAKTFIKNLIWSINNPNTDLVENEDEIGCKSLNFVPDQSVEVYECNKALSKLKEYYPDENFAKMLEYVKNKKYEKAYIDECIEAEGIPCWPSIFWVNSKVAFFIREQKEGYEAMKKYDWHCYMISETSEPETVFKYVKEIK